jgi:ring-1,2-phenylacetyl-CoA epoxidase subunit PaaC
MSPAAATTKTTGLSQEAGDALAELLLALADDEFVIGFMESEWTGIAPLLEEDVAMSSLAQDELGHARAFYELLGTLTGRDADAIAYDRPVEAFRHARLLDHPRGDWAMTVARRYLYDTADAARLEALVTSSWQPLADLVAKIQREERYHRMHADVWLGRLAGSHGEARDRLIAALETLAPDAGSVLAPLDGEAALIEGGLMTRPAASQTDAWRRAVEPRLAELGLPAPTNASHAWAANDARTGHSEAFAWLYEQFTAVRRLDPGATW